MNFLSLIESKREGGTLVPQAIQSLVAEFTAGRIPDYQMAAFLMAVFFRGLDDTETRTLTLAMRDSGEVLDFPEDRRPLVDKHSTGGVGDKVSIPLAPLLACLGFRVPMISGRGLGITGGTLDKLESIPGFNTRPTMERIIEMVQDIGCVICGQTEQMVPADKKIYALRDVTGTVPSIPLIVASILSKKLAEGLQALVLDVKFGRAAFMQTREDAEKLAEDMARLGNECGVHTRALLSDMNTPLGCSAGNWLEVKEAVECLNGSGPADLRELVLQCAASLLVQTGLIDKEADAQNRAAVCLDSGEPLRRWEAMLEAQGADVDATWRKVQQDHTAPAIRELRAARSGIVSYCDALTIGKIVRNLGGGRLTIDSGIQHDVGLDQLAKPGQQIRSGDTLLRIHAMNSEDAENARDKLSTAILLTD